ncbi:MAG: type I-E CRISPR-associated protein Cas6/Cse3/CasE [Armatimonadetes bacterium]|nr:type I-E CRISPR-associated protein Cas6/Cse3/CasE [Armatimonadota bacterium]
MYLSCLLIDVGDNPDRPRPGRLWLRNLYHVHQRLCMAFPSRPRRDDDPDFLAPYVPADFPEQRHLADRNKTEVEPRALAHVHRPRCSDAGILFRIDPQAGGRAIILVQSAAEPKWEYAFRNARYLLAAEPEVKLFDPCFITGQHLKFRLVANPTRRLYENSLGANGLPVEGKWKPIKVERKGKLVPKGKRVPVPADRLLDWLARRAEPAGFSIDKDSTTIQPGYIYMSKKRVTQEHLKEEKKEDAVRMFSVRYEGILEVTDADAFRNAVICGIGPGKAFGFGLLSVAPLR